MGCFLSTAAIIDDSDIVELSHLCPLVPPGSLPSEMKAMTSFFKGKCTYDLHMKFPYLKSFTIDLHM